MMAIGLPVCLGRARRMQEPVFEQASREEPRRQTSLLLSGGTPSCGAWLKMGGRGFGLAALESPNLTGPGAGAMDVGIGRGRNPPASPVLEVVLLERLQPEQRWGKPVRPSMPEE